MPGTYYQPSAAVLEPLPENQSKLNPKAIFLVVILTGVLGVGVGFVASKFAARTASSSLGKSPTSTTTSAAPDVDTTIFGDRAEGVLESGGLGTEGTHKLIRSGGPSQTVYLTSSLVDLDEYVGKKVEVLGQTQKAQKAPWLMDVGRIKLLE